MEMSGNKELGHFCLRDGGHIESLTVHCFGKFHKIRPCLYITEQQLGCDEMDPIRAIRLLARFVNLLLPAFRLILFYGRLFDEMSSHLFQISLRKGTTSIRRQQWPLGHTSERRRERESSTSKGHAWLESDCRLNLVGFSCLESSRPAFLGGALSSGERESKPSPSSCIYISSSFSSPLLFLFFLLLLPSSTSITTNKQQQPRSVKGLPSFHRISGWHTSFFFFFRLDPSLNSPSSSSSLGAIGCGCQKKRRE